MQQGVGVPAEPFLFSFGGGGVVLLPRRHLEGEVGAPLGVRWLLESVRLAMGLESVTVSFPVSPSLGVAVRLEYGMGYWGFSEAMNLTADEGGDG